MEDTEEYFEQLREELGTMQYAILIEKEDIGKTYSTEDQARADAKEISENNPAKWVEMLETDRWGDDDPEFWPFAWLLNGKEYSLFNNKKVKELKRKGLTDIAAIRYAMYLDGISMSKIAECEGAKKSAIQSSIEKARSDLGL